MSRSVKVFKYLTFFVVSFLFPDFLEAVPPHKWQFGFQEPATDLMSGINSLHNTVMLVMGSVILLVVCLLIYVVIRFNRKSNPIPSQVSHNTIIEIIWTLVPLVIVVCISFPSIKLLSYAERVPEPDMTIKVVSYQWYWNYEYVDYDGISFDSNIKYDVEDEGLRLLEVDNRLVVPINKNIKIQITSADVIHSWAVPAFGIKTDAIPGRLNETWMNIKKAGIYYGQCSELCGRLHGFMPIAIEAVSEEEFDKWMKSAKEKFL